MEEQIFGIDMKVNQEYITSVVKQMVQAGIVQALDEKNALTSSIINEILNKKVDKDGNVSNYSSENKYTLLDSCINKMIREETKNVLNETADELRPKLRSAIKKAIFNEATFDKCAEVFVDCMLKNLDSNWHTTFNVEFKKREDY